MIIRARIAFLSRRSNIEIYGLLAAFKDSIFEFQSCYSIGQKQIGSFVETNIKPRKAAFARVKVIPNPRARLLAQVREVIRVKRREFSGIE